MTGQPHYPGRFRPSAEIQAALARVRNPVTDEDRTLAGLYRAACYQLRRAWAHREFEIQAWKEKYPPREQAPHACSSRGPRLGRRTPARRGR
jgi:hypothetical protein